MNERTEWEVVDEPQPQPQQRPALRELLASLLGRWWRWKVAGAALAAGVVLLVVATLSGLILLFTLGTALLTLVAARMMGWLRGLFGQRDGSAHYAPATRPDPWRK
ncbi:MAG: hypothetical protein ACO1N5_06435 [Noviherbaspirillum sp.]